MGHAYLQGYTKTCYEVCRIEKEILFCDNLDQAQSWPQEIRTTTTFGGTKLKGNLGALEQKELNIAAVNEDPNGSRELYRNACALF
jgi:hypothetical protein